MASHSHTADNAHRYCLGSLIHPRHLLAQYAINQIATLELRAQSIVRTMGYPIKHTIPACDRLRHVLSNKHLGLDGSYIDKYFTADEFLEKLFTVLEMPYQPFAEDIAQIKDDLVSGSHSLPKYSLKAEMDFTFISGTDWISCSEMARFTHVYLPDGFAKLEAAERELVIQDSICEHYQRYENDLPHDGIIKSYRLTIENDHIIHHAEYGLPKSSSI